MFRQNSLWQLHLDFSQRVVDLSDLLDVVVETVRVGEGSTAQTSHSLNESTVSFWLILLLERIVGTLKGVV